MSLNIQQAERNSVSGHAEEGAGEIGGDPAAGVGVDHPVVEPGECGLVGVGEDDQDRPASELAGAYGCAPISLRMAPHPKRRMP